MKRKLFFTSIFLCIVISGYSQWFSQASVNYNAGQEAAIAHPNGNIYLIGGYNGLSNAMDSVSIFNQATNTWSKGAPIPYPTRAPAYALGPDSMIYIFGGYNVADGDSCYKYNTITNKWTKIANIPTGIWFAAAATAPNGKIYVFGGENALSLVQIYDPKLNTWSSGTPIPVPVQQHGAVTGSNGKIYIIGGLDPGVTDSVQVYDPVADSWSRGKPMPTARDKFAYTWDNADGLIYCIGGGNNYGNDATPYYNVVEMYNVYTDSWTTGLPIPNGLNENTAASVNNGINVFGGADTAVGYCAHNFRLNVTPLAVKNDLGAGEGFNVFPNPSSGKVNIWVVSMNAENLTINIMDITGQVIYSHTWSDFSGEDVKNMDMTSFGKGMYFIQYISDKSNVVKKLVLQ